MRSLCLMLQALAGVSALCQKALIFTAGPADFVQRLWMSHLKVCVPISIQKMHDEAIAVVCLEVTQSQHDWSSLHVWF